MSVSSWVLASLPSLPHALACGGCVSKIVAKNKNFIRPGARISDLWREMFFSWFLIRLDLGRRHVRQRSKSCDPILASLVFRPLLRKTRVASMSLPIPQPHPYAATTASQ